MKTSASQLIDLSLTQAIVVYREMEPETAYDAIAKDWPEQIAALLVEFLFKTVCSNCGGTSDFIEMEREQGLSKYIVPICGCEWSEK